VVVFRFSILTRIQGPAQVYTNSCARGPENHLIDFFLQVREERGRGKEEGESGGERWGGERE
jgi:hypothetical protein